MHIVVCIKQVPETSEVEVDPVTGVLKRDGIGAKINPYDLFAIETALQVKATVGGTVTAVTMGPPQAEAAIRETYMLGVDHGVLLTDRGFAGSDVLATAYTLAQGIAKLAPSQLIICGKQTTDGDTAQVGAEIAEFLGISHIANVGRILAMSEDSITVEMDMPTTVEVVRATLPCLLTVERDIYAPRLPSFRRKLATRAKAVQCLRLQDLADQEPTHYGLDGSPTQVQRIFPPPVNSCHELWEGSAATLSKRLFDKLLEQKQL